MSGMNWKTAGAALTLMLTSTSAFASPVQVPEPSTMALLGVGVAGIVLLARRK